MKLLLWDFKLAWRLLNHIRKERSRRSGRFFSVSFIVAVAGMSFGVMSLLLALGITEGFSRQYEKSVLGSQPHLIINSEDDVNESEKLTSLIKEEVEKTSLQTTSIQPVLYREGMLIGGKSLKGIVLKGVNLEAYFKVAAFKLTLDKLTSGYEKNEKNLPEIYLGKAAAKESGLKPGVVKILFPKNEHLKEITAKDLKSFFLAGVFESGVYEVDSSFALLDLKTAQDFFAVKAVSGLEVWLNDFQKASFISEKLRDVLSFPYEVLSWKEVNENVFKALETEKWMFGVLMLVLVVVASLNVLGTLMMLLLKKRHEIALLRALGYTWSRLKKLFLITGLMIGIWGITIGIIGGLLCEWILKTWEPIQLDPEIYFLKTVPIVIEWTHVGSVVLASSLVCIFGCLLTLRKISQISTTQILVDK